MKPRPGVPFSWHFGGNFGEKGYTSLVLRKRRLTREFHNTGYYEHANDVWVKTGGWTSIGPGHLGYITFGYSYLRIKNISIQGRWIIK